MVFFIEHFYWFIEFEGVVGGWGGSIPVSKIIEQINNLVF